MEIAGEETGLEPEEEPQPEENMAQQGEGTVPWIIQKHYSPQNDSSEKKEDEDSVFLRKLYGGYGDYTCWVCGETFLNNLIEHFRVHRDQVWCHFCQGTFTCSISLALHLKNAHPNNHLYCASCKVMFSSTWHMNQHMGQHLENGKFKQPQSETEKPQWLGSERVTIKTKGVEVMSKEKEKIPLRKMQERKVSCIPGSTKKEHLTDHNYCSERVLREPSVSSTAPAYKTHSSTRVHKENVTKINSEPVHLINKNSNTKVSEPAHKKVEVVVFHSLPQRVVTGTCRVGLQEESETVVKRQIAEKNYPETRKQEATDRSSLSSSTSAELKVEGYEEDNLWECAPIEDDLNDEENSENDSTPDSSLLSSMEDLSSETKTASKDSPENGSIRLLWYGTVQKRGICTKTNDKSDSSVKVSAVTECGTLNSEPLGSESSSLRSVNPSATPAKTANRESSITRSTKEKCLTDHNYYCRVILRESNASNQALEHYTPSSTRVQKENGKSRVGRSSPPREEVTDTCRVSLKTHKQEGKPYETKEQEDTPRSSVFVCTSVKLEPVEDDVEDNLWERAPIEEDIEFKDENFEIEEESDSAPDNPFTSFFPF